MDYKGYKLIDKIMLICRDVAEREESRGILAQREDYQAYLVDPSNKSQIETARNWAKWTEYGPSYRNDEGEWVRDYEIEHLPVEFEFDNDDFEFELLDCAGGSSQGGKLSFWNCVVTKDNKRFVIGINSDMLLDLLKNATFDKGKCKEKLVFITQKGRVGMTVKGSDTYQQCIKDKELMSNLKNTQTSKFSFGDRVSTATINDVYLGTITKYYDFDPGEKNATWRYNHFDIRECKITKLKKPVTYHLFESLYRERSLKTILDEYDSSIYSYPDIKKTCPKRTIIGKIEMDCSEEEFKQGIMNKTYDFKPFSEKLHKSYNYKCCDKYRTFYYFLGKQTFGYGFEPFELSEEIMSKIEEYGIKYVDESL